MQKYKNAYNKSIFMNNINQALKIASDNLRACYSKEGIFAGLHHFKDYWARDSFFASYGSLVKEDYDIVRQNLKLFLRNINAEGQIPLRIGKNSLGIVFSFYGFNLGKRKAVYKTDKSHKKTVDQNSLFIISLYEYMKATKDKKFLANNIEKVEKVMKWNFLNDKDKDLLIEENEYCNWADSIKKKGKVLYTNVCHCHALYCISKVYEKSGDKNKSKTYLNLHKKVKNKINELFWSGEHYLDWIDSNKRYNYFSTDGNILAILWDIADKEKARHIEEASHIFDINEIPSQCVHPNYPDNYVSLQTKLLGLKDYHNGLSWLWLGCINALAKNKLGMKKKAIELLDKISSLIIKHRHVYEVYDKNGPVKRFFYKAESPFAWSSGLFIYAVKEIIG